MRKDKRSTPVDINEFKNKQEYYNPYSRDRINYHHTERTSSNINIPRQQEQPVRVNKAEFKRKNKLSKAQLIRMKRKRRRMMIKRLFLFLVGSIIAVWSVVKMKDVFSYSKISYQTVQMGTIDNSMQMNGIIARNEKVYKSSKAGTLYYITGEGEKVSKNGDICVIANREEAIRIKQESEQVESKIYAKQEKRESLSYYQDEVYRINQEIMSTMQDYYLDINKETTQHIGSVRKKLEKNIEERTNVYAREKYDALKEEQEKKTVLDNKLTSIKSTEKAEATGIVSYIIDGNEDKISNNTLEKLTYSEYKDLYEKIKNSQLVTSSFEIKQNMPVYKLILEDKWSIVSYIDKNKADSYKAGENYTLNFPDNGNMSLDFRLKSKIEEKDQVRLIFETDDYLSSFLDARKVSFSIGSKKEGLKIPLQAIVERSLIKIPSDCIVRRNNDLGVLRKKENQVEWVKVSEQYEKEGYVYVLQDIANTYSIAINDFIQNPTTKEFIKLDKLESGKGVYVINGKLAQFKPIEIEIENKEYAIVKESSTNNGLKAFDKIISNSKSVQEDDLLRYMKIQNE